MRDPIIISSRNVSCFDDRQTVDATRARVLGQKRWSNKSAGLSLLSPASAAASAGQHFKETS